jgi:CheY-like chemotaxis protein
MGDDDEDDRTLLEAACADLNLNIDLRTVVDGADLIDYLLRCLRRNDAGSPPVPDLILVDLNMPRANGHQVLSVIRAFDEFQRLPVIVLSNSKDPKDIKKAYERGATAFVAKPQAFEGLKPIILFAISQVSNEPDGN